MERLVDKLPPFTAKDATEFMAWAFAVKAHFTRIPGFKADVLSKPRSELQFDSNSEYEIEFLYQYMWERLYPVVLGLSGGHSKLTRLHLFDVCGLW